MVEAKSLQLDPCFEIAQRPMKDSWRGLILSAVESVHRSLFAAGEVEEVALWALVTGLAVSRLEVSGIDCSLISQTLTGLVSQHYCPYEVNP